MTGNMYRKFLNRNLDDMNLFGLKALAETVSHNFICVLIADIHISNTEIIIECAKWNGYVAYLNRPGDSDLNPFLWYMVVENSEEVCAHI